jgi:hypothetical protein
MKHLKTYQIFESKDNDTINSIDVKKGPYKGSWSIKYSCEQGKGNALIFDNTSNLNDVKLLNMKNKEMYLFGIGTTPRNSGVGKLFLKDIFHYFDIDTIYLPSDENHPAWNKISTVVSKLDHHTIFKIEREQL